MRLWYAVPRTQNTRTRKLHARLLGNSPRLCVLTFLIPAAVRYFCADESWKPFLLSLALDVSSRMFVGEYVAFAYVPILRRNFI
jgi:hypothetical protein